MLNSLVNREFYQLIDHSLLSGDPEYYFSEIQTFPGYSFLNIIHSLASLLIIPPLMLGCLNWYLRATDNENDGISKIFWAYGCKAYFKSILLPFLVGLKSALAALIPFILLSVISGFIFLPADFSSVSPFSPFLLALTASAAFSSLFACIFALRYSLTDMLICEKYSLSVSEAFRRSVRYTKGHIWEIILFYLSFVPWMISCVFIFPAFYVVPYFSMSKVMFFRYLYETGTRQESASPLSPDKAFDFPDTSAPDDGYAVL